ncbi:MAG: hypothetical protein K8R57_06125 [Verrucomicrobia bacterium]|nr:hypothetical protein [Verrucomicrobiota bacterium]
MISFLSALPRRQLYLGAIAILLAVILIARWIANWGLVTIHAEEQPLAKVIASIARQGGVRMESSLDLSKRVTMDAVKVTPVEALEILAGAMESGWRVVYLAAPTKTALNEAIASLNGTGKIDAWTTSYYPGPGGAGGAAGAEYGQVIDPRFLSIAMEGPDPDLAKLLDEAAQKSGVMIALPKEWSPPAKLPKPTSVRKIVSSLVGSAHGKSAEFFFLSERARRGWGGAGPEDGEGGPDSASGSRLSGSMNQPADVGRRPHANPDWMEQRQLAQIKKLPSDKQAQALKDKAERKAFFDSLKGLTPADRMAKIQDMMANSEMGQKMQDSQLVRQSQQTAERRITRAVNYLNHKAAAKAAQ